jgi:osmoprotectant transport system permease protein
VSLHFTLGFLGVFGDAIDFILHPQEARIQGTLVGGPDQVLHLTGQHLKVTFLALGLATAIALPTGVVLGHIRKGEAFAISLGNAGRAVPELALIAFVAAFIGVGLLNVTFAFAVLGIPPILTNAYVGVGQVDRDTVDAARGMGMSGAQVVRQVELPLALPLIFGGIKTSTVNVIATATIAPLVGVLTLGDPIISGSVHGRAGQIGASIVVAVLAVIAELSLSAVQRAVTPAGVKLERRAASAPSRFGTLKRRIQTAP